MPSAVRDSTASATRRAAEGAGVSLSREKSEDAEYAWPGRRGFRVHLTLVMYPTSHRKITNCRSLLLRMAVRVISERLRVDDSCPL